VIQSLKQTNPNGLFASVDKPTLDLLKSGEETNDLINVKFYPANRKINVGGSERKSM